MALRVATNRLALALRNIACRTPTRLKSSGPNDRESDRLFLSRLQRRPRRELWLRDGRHVAHVRPANRRDQRLDRRLSENRSNKRRVEIVMRERGGKTYPFVVASEDAAVP